MNKLNRMSETNEELNLGCVIVSCNTCLYSKGGKTSCNRHLNKIKPDYSKGVECFHNGMIHYRPYEEYKDKL